MRCLLLLMLTAAASHALPLVQPVRVFDAAAIERVLRQEMADTSTPGAAIAIVRGSEVLYHRGFGVASIETGEPVTAETLFRLGSTTKMFTGLAAVLLAGEHRVALDQPIAKWSTGLDPAVGALTLEGLLSHTAGMINEGSANGSHDDEALARRVRSWTAAHIFAPPGDVYSYSSPGYWLAGHVIEHAAGKPYADVLGDRIFTPLGMMRTTFRPLVAMTYPMAQDHRLAGGKATVVRPYPDDVSTWPGGSLFSSARDMARFALAFLDDGRVDGKQVLPAAAIEAMRTRQSDTGSGCGYTYGLADCTTNGVRTLSHYGFRSGSGSIVVLAPSERVAIILLANRAGGILTRTEAEAKRMLLGITGAAAEPSPPMKEAELRALAGRYVNGPDALTLSVRDATMTYSHNGGPEQPVKALGVREIAVTDAGGAIVQPFLVLKGRVTGDTYLSDGISAFRKQRKP
jgi:CubicO group peptidase (beta-lactamase class C family)